MVDASDDSEEEEMKRAFFQELEARHGGPLTYDDLRRWDETLNSQSPPPLPPKQRPPRTGWLTPSTPHLPEQRDHARLACRPESEKKVGLRLSSLYHFLGCRRRSG